MKTRWMAGLMALVVSSGLLLTGAPVAHASSKGRRNTTIGLGAATAVAGGLAGAVYGALIEPRRVRVRRLDLPLPSWPTGLDGLRVAVVSDLHAGGPHVNADRPTSSDGSLVRYYRQLSCRLRR